MMKFGTKLGTDLQSVPPRVSQPARLKRTGSRSGSKKKTIINLYRSGLHDLQEISDQTYSRLSYVASVLQAEKLIHGYYDLYNEAEEPMNAYTDYFRKRLGYRNTETAMKSVHLLHEAYLEFEALGDRAGQHHTLSLAMKMYNRARWSGKTAEARIFKRWLVRALDH